MYIDVKATVIGVSDRHGNYDTVVVNDMSDTVQICGLMDNDGDYVFFESEAYHIQKWANEHGLKYVCKTGSIEIDI